MDHSSQSQRRFYTKERSQINGLHVSVVTRPENIKFGLTWPITIIIIIIIRTCLFLTFLKILAKLSIERIYSKQFCVPPEGHRPCSFIYQHFLFIYCGSYITQRDLFFRNQESLIEISCILCDPKMYYCPHNSPLGKHILGQINSLNILPHYFCKINFSNIFPVTPRSSSSSFPFSVFNQKFIYIYMRGGSANSSAL
jgi:hypothetical protein